MGDDRLLARYATTRDAEAFRLLVERYASLVYATCRRITGNRHDAEDATQESFLALARHAGSIRTFLPAWLHTTARRTALAITQRTHKHRTDLALDDLAASEPTRVRIEDREPIWAELEPHIDAAMGELDEDLRAPLVLYYLHGQTQSQIAQQLGVDQSTISRTLDKGVTQLRQNLRRVGIEVSAPSLVALLPQGAKAAPPELTAALGKLALAGVGPKSVAGTGAPGLVKVTLAAIVLVACAGAMIAASLRKGEAVTSANPKPTTSPMMSDRRPDFSKLQLRHNIEREDGFSATMVAVARLLGREVNYQSVYILSGNAFAPDIWPMEPTKAHWQMQGRGRNIDLVCARLGLTCRPLPRWDELTQAPPYPQDRSAREAWLRDYFRKPHVSLVNQALDTGQVIVSMGEWESKPPTWTPNWTEWGVITEASDDGTILGAASNGRLDNPVTHIRDAFIIGPGEITMTQEAGDREILRRAIARLRGTLPADMEWGRRGIVFGLPAMDAWIKQMQADLSDGDARKTAMPTVHGAQAAARYLRSLATTAVPAARRHLFAAAGQYENISGLLEPFTAEPQTTATAADYRTVLATPELRQAHIDTVLKPVRASFASAADELEKALAATREP